MGSVMSQARCRCGDGGRRGRAATRHAGRVMVQRALVILLVVVVGHVVHRGGRVRGRVHPVVMVVARGRRVGVRVVRRAEVGVALVQLLVHLHLGRLDVLGAGRGGRRRAGQQPRDAERVAGGGVRRLLLQAARHPVVEGGGRLRDEVRVKASADHRGQLVVRRAEVRPEQAAYVGRVALQARVVLVEARRRRRRRVMVVVRGDQRVEVLVVLLLGPVVERRGRALLGRVGELVGGGAVVAGRGRDGDRGRGRRRPRVVLLVLVVLPGQLLLLVLEPLLPSKVAPVLEHVPALGVQGPERALARLVRGARHLHEAIVEAERVPDRVLPPLLILPVEREQIHDELVDLGQGEHLGRRVLDRHRDQADVRVGRLRVGVAAPVRLVGPRPLQGRVGRVGLGQGERVPGHPGAAARRQGPVPDGAHARATAAHRRAPVPTHATAAHRGHPHGRAHAAHVEPAGALGAAARPDSDAHRHAHRHASHRVDRAVRRRHAAHRGHRGAGHRAAEATSVAVQLLRLEHGHRADRCRGGGLLSARQTRVMKTSVPRLLLLVMRRVPNLLLGQENPCHPSETPDLSLPPPPALLPSFETSLLFLLLHLLLFLLFLLHPVAYLSRPVTLHLPASFAGNYRRGFNETAALSLPRARENMKNGTRGTRGTRTLYNVTSIDHRGNRRRSLRRFGDVVFLLIDLSSMVSSLLASPLSNVEIFVRFSSPDD